MTIEEARASTQVNRAAKTWSEYAKEPVTVEEIGGQLYAFGSELACLRLEHHMRVGRAAWSPNLKTWTYSTDRPLYSATICEECAKQSAGTIIRCAAHNPGK